MRRKWSSSARKLSMAARFMSGMCRSMGAGGAAYNGLPPMGKFSRSLAAAARACFNAPVGAPCGERPEARRMGLRRWPLQTNIRQDPCEERSSADPPGPYLSVNISTLSLDKPPKVAETWVFGGTPHAVQANRTRPRPNSYRLSRSSRKLWRHMQRITHAAGQSEGQGLDNPKAQAPPPKGSTCFAAAERGRQEGRKIEFRHQGPLLTSSLFIEAPLRCRKMRSRPNKACRSSGACLHIPSLCLTCRLCRARG